MIDDVTKTQQDLHPTINHQTGIYTLGELLTKTDEGKGGLAKKSISEYYSVTKRTVNFMCMLRNY